MTGWAACRLWGASFFDGLLPDGRTRRPVPLALGSTGHLRGRAGSTLLRERLDPDEIVLIHGIPCTVRRRALFDEMRLAEDAREATVSMDMMAAAGQVSVRQMREYVDPRAGWSGVPQARAALHLADECSLSPNETRMRNIWVIDAGLPRPLVNQPIWDLHGRLLGIADLLDPVAGVVGEFDGAEHRRARRHTRDAAREDLMRRAGLEYFKVTGLDLPDRRLVADRMLATRDRALRVPPTTRGWTITPPPDWKPAPTLDELFAERAQADAQRGTWPS